MHSSLAANTGISFHLHLPHTPPSSPSRGERPRFLTGMCPCSSVCNMLVMSFSSRKGGAMPLSTSMRSSGSRLSSRTASRSSPSDGARHSRGCAAKRDFKLRHYAHKFTSVTTHKVMQFFRCKEIVVEHEHGSEGETRRAMGD